MFLSEKQEGNTMTAIDDPWDRVYQTTQAYNYKKREETFITSTSKEEARKNADQLIESEEMAKLKAERKEAKKKRQKERKKAEKAQNSKEEKSTLSNSLTSSESNITSKTNKTETAEENDDEHSECYDQEDDDIDDEVLDINAAFFKVSIKQNKNITSNKTSVPKVEKVSPPLDSMSTSMPKSAKLENTKSQSDTPEAFGMRSCHLAINNDFVGAIDSLSQAISRAPEDVRHFLNRSYCYLRLGQYTLALNDAQFAKKKSQEMEHLAKAIAREGQALCGLQKYPEAKKCFEEILMSEEGNEWILTELILTRALQLTNMGFPKIDALKALQQCSSVVDAVMLLTSGSISSPELETNISTSDNESCDGDEVYFSDDESSNTIFLSKLVSTMKDESCFLENLRSQPSASKIQQYSSGSESTLHSSISTESLPHSNDAKSNDNIHWEVKSNSKLIPSSSKTAQIQKPIISDSSSIWVGSVDKSISEHKLREVFGVYGKINYVRRFPDERNYVFIDYASKKAATKALNNSNGFEINGVKLPVKPAPGIPGKK